MATLGPIDLNAIRFRAHAGDPEGSTPSAPDETAPEFLFATALDDQLTIWFNEELQTSPTPATTEFSIVINGNAPISPNSVNISGSTVILTLPSSVVDTDVITVSYTAGTVADTSGNSATSFSDENVTYGGGGTPYTGDFIRGHSSHDKSITDLSHLSSTALLTAYRDDALFENIFAGSPNWSYLDSRMNKVSQAGLSTFLIICAYGTTASATYASRCVQVAHRYGPGGSFWTANPGLTPVDILLEVWNEPYMPATYVTPSTLASMCGAAVDAVHALGLNIPIGPNLDYINYNTGADGYASAFVSAYPGGSDLPDFVAGHPYTDPESLGTNTTTGNQKYRIDRILLLRDTIAAAGGGWASMPMLVTEFGWSSQGVGESNQATFAHNGFELIYSWGVIGAFYYTGDRANTNLSDHYSQYGIIRADGTDKPAVASIGSAVTS